MFKRILILTLLLLVATFLRAGEPVLADVCEDYQIERVELRAALRKSHVLETIEVYKQQIDDLSTRFAENCLTEAQIVERQAAFFNEDINLLESEGGKPLSEQAYLEKQAAWQRFYILPPECMDKPLKVKNLNLCIDNRQFQYQKFDMLWQQKDAQIARAETKLTDRIHEFVLPSNAQRTILSAEEQLKRYRYVENSFFPYNIIVWCLAAVIIFFSLIFIFHRLMRTQPIKPE